MYFLKGRVITGVRHFTNRMTKYPEVFQKATGEILFPGTINVQVDKSTLVKEHFRIRGIDIDEPEQDLLFEICKINQIWAYRIRPYNLRNGSGGHGDNILEISSAEKIQNVLVDSYVEIALFRDDLKNSIR